MVKHAMAVCAALLLIGCDQPSSVSVTIGDPATKTPEPRGPAAIIVAPPARRALADGIAWLVDDGVSPLGTAVRKPGPAMVVHFVDDSRPILYNRLHRLTYHGQTAKFGRAFPVDDEDLVELGLEPPAEAVWTFGPLGPCSATVGQPWVGRPSADVRVFEISYALEGCGTEGRWAPVASTTTAMPKGVTWRDAQTSEDQSFAPDEAWAHPLAPYAKSPAFEAEGSFVAHARWVAAYEPRPAQTLVTALQPAAGEGCGTESHESTLGFWLEDGLEPIEIEAFDPTDPPLLVGAIGWGPDTVALVFDDGLDGVLAVAPAETEDLGPPSWVLQPLVAGRWSADDRRDAKLVVQPCD